MKKVPKEGLVTLFGRRLRQLRKERGFTQEKLALESGCDVSYIGLMERGTKAASLRILERLSSALNLQPLEFFVFSDIRQIPAGDALKEKFALLSHNPEAQTMLSFALDTVAQYTKRGTGNENREPRTKNQE